MSTGRGRDQRRLPIACRLDEDARERRRGTLARELLSGSEELHELDDGFELVFPGDADQAERLVRFVVSERGCCPFLAFEMIFEPEGGHIALRVRGPEGAKELVGAELVGIGAP